jgi:hypothetical protein
VLAESPPEEEVPLEANGTEASSESAESDQEDHPLLADGWNLGYDNFYQLILHQDSKAEDFDLAVPEEAMRLGLWRGRKVVSLEEWFNEEALEKLDGIRLELVASMKAGKQEIRPEWIAGEKAMEFLHLDPDLGAEVERCIHQACDAAKKEDRRAMDRAGICLDRVGRALRERNDKCLQELLKRLDMGDLSDPWWAWTAKRVFLGQMRIYLRVTRELSVLLRIREHLAAMKG